MKEVKKYVPKKVVVKRVTEEVENEAGLSLRSRWIERIAATNHCSRIRI